MIRNGAVSRLPNIDAAPLKDDRSPGPLSARGGFWYAGDVKSSVSIALFFLLSGFFLTVLLGAIEHSGKLLGVAGVCLAAVVCIIVFLSPVQLPSWQTLRDGASRNAETTSTESSSPSHVTGATGVAIHEPTTSSTPTTTESLSVGAR